MRRSCVIVLFLAVSHHVTCSLITDRVTKDIPIEDAEVDDNNIVPEGHMFRPWVKEIVAPNVATVDTGCAKVGEFCINGSDCCSGSCLGFLKRCVSGREDQSAH